MGNEQSGGGQQQQRPGSVPTRPAGRSIVKSASQVRRFEAIADKYSTLEQVQEALRKGGLESSQLIIAVDYTKSNEWTGKHSFGGRCLHDISPGAVNPYEQVISIVGRTLSSFDDDGLISAVGFGDATTQDSSVFSFFPGGHPAHGVEALQSRYRELTPHVKLAGPTSFAPAIYEAMKITAASGCQFHILILIADGQVTRPSDMPASYMSRQEDATVRAIVSASSLPLSIIMVGVGDGPWEVMQEFDDKLPARQWDNFQFVNFTNILSRFRHDPARLETRFAVDALMEIPDQFKLIQRLGLLGQRVSLQTNVRCAEPPAVRTPSAVPGFPMGPAPGSFPGVPSGGSAFVGDVKPTSLTSTHPGSDQIDSLFICPITQDIMKDPVICSDGYTYERAAISQWMSTKNTSPLTNQPFQHNNLTPNHMLRSSIQEWQQKTGKV